MHFNYKLFFKYLFLNITQVFLNENLMKNTNTNVYLNSNSLYYLILHFKLSSLFYSIQLTELFSYESPIVVNSNNSNQVKIESSLIVYNFNIIQNNSRIFVFTLNNLNSFIKDNSIFNTFLNSIVELFPNSNWLEREVAELHGIFFHNKKDLRNLLLPYGDTSAPMKKSFPSIGLREIFYDSNSDLLIQNNVTLQF